MNIYIETYWGSLAKWGEELCGDNVEMVRTPEAVVVVVADGLGSGVKANILSKMTAKIIATMFEKGADLPAIVETVTNTLPVCQRRQIAYSTFTIIEAKQNGEIYVVEFDNPGVFYLKNGKLLQMSYQESEICGKKIKESRFHASAGDVLVAVSDGVIHAGIGAILNLGWQWNDVAEYLQKLTPLQMDTNDICQELLDACQELYAGKPGDDATVMALQLREPRTMTVAVGPPLDHENDQRLMQLLKEESGKRVVCGGTTGTIVAKELGETLLVDLSGKLDPEVPPVGKIKGIDLVTEGIITLSKTLYYLKSINSSKDIKDLNGATSLAKMLLTCDRIHFVVGRAINPAHQNPNLPINLGLKLQVVSELTDLLKKRGKEVKVEYL